jgi:hypothetical protein
MSLVQKRQQMEVHKERHEVTNMQHATTQADRECSSPVTRGRMGLSTNTVLPHLSTIYRAGLASRPNIRELKYPLLKPGHYVRTSD